MSPRTRRSAGFHFVLAVTALVCFGAFVGKAAAQAAPPPVAVGGECELPRYKELAQTAINSMGDVEYDHFLDLDGECRTRKRLLAEAVAGAKGTYNACAHPPYVTLLPKPPIDMTVREFGYFRVVDRECAAYKQTGGAPPPPQPAKSSSGSRVLAVLAVLGSIATLLASQN
jgi:hypothetical protein